MMGGILSNNSSGMQTGTRYNSYHTLSAIEFMLANGHRYNSSVAADRQRFEQEEEWLCQGLLRIREQILKDVYKRQGWLNLCVLRFISTSSLCWGLSSD